MMTERKFTTQTSAFSGKQYSWNQFFLQILPLMMIATLPALYGAWRIYYQFTYFGPAAYTTNLQNWFIGTGILLILILILFLRNRLISKKQVSVFHEGIRIEKPFRKQIDIFWDEITELYTHHYRNSSFIYKTNINHRLVLTTDHGNIRLGKSIDDLEKLISLIKSKIYPLMLSAQQQSFTEGEELEFGPIKINNKGFHFDTHQIDWQSIQRINISSGWLSVILNDDQKFRLKSRKIPNIEILLAITRQVLQSS